MRGKKFTVYLSHALAGWVGRVAQSAGLGIITTVRLMVKFLHVKYFGKEDELANELKKLL